MPQHIEPLSGGLVTSRDPSLLAEGELSQADDCIYKPNDPALFSTPGRSKFNQAAIDPITGLRYCGFDAHDDDVLIAQTATDYMRAPIHTGVFESVAEIAGGTNFDSVHYQNRHYLLNGVDENRVLRQDGTVRLHGLDPVTATPPVLLVQDGLGTWPLGEGSVPNYYEYWTTEAYIDDELGEEFESTFTGTPKTVFVENLTDSTIINRPTQVNAQATHWRVYRSISKSIDVGLAFPNGFRIASIKFDSGESSFNDGKSTTSGPFFAGTVDNVGNTLALIDRFGIDSPPYPPQATTAAIPWTDKDRLKADDGSSATGTSTFLFSDRLPTAILSGFSITGIGSTITRIRVNVQGSHSTNAGLVAVALSSDDGRTWTGSASIFLTTTANTTKFAEGLWGRSWNPLDFNEFRVGFWAYDTGADVTHTIDYVSVEIFHSGTTASAAVPFGSLQPLIPIGRDGPPPIAFTGDIFEDSLVLNDVENPTFLQYSHAEHPDSFPASYLLAMQTKDKDVVRCIKTLGNVLMVGLYSKLFRVSYLPRVDDAEFDRGRAIDVISVDHGIVGPRAAAVFQMDSQPLQMAYVSRYGLHMTDGYRVTTLTNDIDWTEVNLADNCELTNDPSNYQLVLFTPSNKYHFSYHPVHLKDGKLKVSGPVSYAAKASAVASLASGSTGFYTAKSDGFVYVENSGSVDASGGEITPTFRTRDMYLAGLGNEWKLEKMLLHHEAPSGTELTGSLRIEKTNATSRNTTAKSFPGLVRGLGRLPLNDMGEGIGVQVTADGPAKFNYLVIEGEGFGTEDSLR